MRQQLRSAHVHSWLVSHRIRRYEASILHNGWFCVEFDGLCFTARSIGGLIVHLESYYRRLQDETN